MIDVIKCPTIMGFLIIIVLFSFISTSNTRSQSSNQTTNIEITMNN